MKKTEMYIPIVNDNQYELCNMEIKGLKLKVTELSEEINQLKQQLNKYEDPEDMTLMTMWATEKAKDEIKRLKLKNKRLKQTLTKLLVDDEIDELLKGDKNE